jgi:hypothetical protein
MGWASGSSLPFSDRMLWAAVLRRAVFDYVLYKGVRSRSIEWKKAFQYIFTEGLRYEDGVSFEEVCEMFGWDPDYLRRLTTQLTRADIKKMETTQFREDFVYDVVKVAVEQTEKWRTANFAAPFLPLYKFNKEHREKLKPRVISRESFFGSSVQLLQWQATAVAM